MKHLRDQIDFEQRNMLKRVLLIFFFDLIDFVFDPIDFVFDPIDFVFDLIDFMKQEISL